MQSHVDLVQLSSETVDLVAHAPPVKAVAIIVRESRSAARTEHQRHD